MPRHKNKNKRARTRNYPYCLCVIDMQPRFPASQDPATIQACLNHVQTAMDDGAFIVIAQYTTYGKTDRRIVDLVSDYRNAGYCHASQDSKADSVMRLLNRNNVQTKEFRVCGVNLEACVYATAYGLKFTYRKEIVLCEDACNSVCAGVYYADSLHQMKKDGMEIRY